MQSLKQEKDPIPIDPLNADPVILNGERPLVPAFRGSRLPLGGDMYARFLPAPELDRVGEEVLKHTR
jgi:hypothetical protein